MSKQTRGSTWVIYPTRHYCLGEAEEREEVTVMSPAEKAKELVESYITWCDSDEAPTTATSWGEVMMKWPTVWARTFPEVAQAFR